MVELERIESPTNPKVKLVVKLHSAAHRKEEDKFVAEGVRLAEMAIKSDWPVEFAFVSDTGAENQRAMDIVNTLIEKECSVYQVSDKVYERVADTVNPQGLLLVMRNRIFSWQELLNSKDNAPLIVVLDGIQDPGNAGTIIRTAEALGCSGVVCLENTVDVFADKTVRSSMGSVFNIPIITNVSYDDLIDVCHENEISLVATALDDTAIRHYMSDYVSPCAIVFGNEGNGVSEKMLQESDRRVYIPMSGQAESLNVSAAVAIVLYEAFRQRSIL
ncbi:MAG: RNA methyltransferase [Anaerovibrio sp.]|nr:RNA methyltransferase [Anaerovibrio sp.]